GPRHGPRDEATGDAGGEGAVAPRAPNSPAPRWAVHGRPAGGCHTHATGSGGEAARARREHGTAGGVGPPAAPAQVGGLPHRARRVRSRPGRGDDPAVRAQVERLTEENVVEVECTAFSNQAAPGGAEE